MALSQIYSKLTPKNLKITNLSDNIKDFVT